MSRIGYSARRREAEIPRDLAISAPVGAAGARLALLGLRNAFTAAAFGCLLCACVVTDPIDFKDEVDVPPVILDDPTLPNGSIIKFEKLAAGDPGAKEIVIDLQIRDDNVHQSLSIRTRITKADGSTILSKCPDTALARQGEPISYYPLTIPQTSLNSGECHKVEVVVSGHFGQCYDDTARANRFFDVVSFDHPDDIARATYWIWEVGNNVLADPVAAQTLVSSCRDTVEYNSKAASGASLP